MNVRQIVAGYLTFQAAGTAAWWLILLLHPASMDWFKPGSWPAEALLGFWLADSAFLIAGSLAAAYAVLADRAWAKIALWSLAAAAWYPALYCIGVSILTGEAWVASAMMVSMAGLTLAMATIHGSAGQQPAAIRATPMSRTAAVGWTLAQIVIFWCIFLWILPKGIVELERQLNWPAFQHSVQTAISLALFIAASALGLWSGLTMATAGDGTPLPTATAPNLVVAGPYKFVRNPMALAGVVQSLAVGWLLGSFSVIGYAIAGALVWHVFVRPVEERDLQQRFGDRYLRYKRSVGLWIPRQTGRSVHAIDEVGAEFRLRAGENTTSEPKPSPRLRSTMPGGE